MIAKITTGADPMGLARYLMGPGRETPHTYRDGRGRLFEGGQVIGGTVTAGADRMRWARDLERAASANTQVAKPVWHCSLRAAPGDRRLTDAEWADIGQDVAEHMGYGEHPWAMVRHDDDHVHIVVSRVDFEGVTWKNSHDRWRVVEAMRAVEQRYGLTEVASPARAQRQVSTGERRQAQRTGQVPARQQLREVITAARDTTAGQGAEAFEQALAASPLARVRFRRNESPSTGRMNGYSFHLAGHTDAQGQPVWLSASKIDRGLSWSRLQKVLDGPVPEHLAPETQVPRKRMERATTWRARRAEAGAAAHREYRWETAGQRLDVLASATGTTAQAKWQQARSALEEQRKGDEDAARAREMARIQGTPVDGRPLRAREGRKFGDNRLTNNRMTRGNGTKGGKTRPPERGRDDERGR